MNRVLNFALICMMAAMFQQYITIKGKLDDSKRLRDSSSERESQRALLDSVHTVGSSVWCEGQNDDHTERLCWIHNLCYSPKYNEFMLFHSNRTRLKGVPKDRFTPALQDLSSVKDHSAHYFNFVDYPVDAAKKLNIQTVSGTALVFKRFKPDNLMHVLHDDLLPIYVTLQNHMQVSDVASHDIKLVFIDNRDAGKHQILYELFSTQKPLFRNDLDLNSVTCFEKTLVGVSKATTWYQYGFKIPQGPIPNAKVNGCTVREFANFVRSQLSIKQAPNDSKEYIALISRKMNRLILNEIEVLLAATKTLGMRTVTLSSETHSIPEIIAVVSGAVMVIGMHGALLALAAFMQPASALIELYPYAVNPNNYTPYKTLAELPNMNVIYKYWVNQNEQNTFPHPESEPEFGGIMHLPVDVQERLNSSKEVSPHLCCSDPEWLYRIYQDTVVDIQSFETTLREAYNERKELLTVNIGKCDTQIPLFPGPVMSIDCGVITDNTRLLVEISWTSPNNLAYLNPLVIQYEVLIQEKGKKDISAFLLSTENFTFASDSTEKKVYYIWVRSIVDKTARGAFNSMAFECNV